jgi:hypothetical protein
MPMAGRKIPKLLADIFYNLNKRIVPTELKLILYCVIYSGARGGGVGWGTAVEVGRSGVRFLTYSKLFLFTYS